MTLPTNKTAPKKDIQDFVTLIYGPPKIGKSTFCAGADGALFLSTEPGLNFLEVYQTEILTWKEFLEACGEIRGSKHEFRTIVIDTIDNLYKMCAEYVLGKHNVDHQSDLEFGKGWDLVNTELMRRLNALALLPYGLMMVSHAQDKEVKARTGKERRIAPTLPNSAAKHILSLADFILYAETVEATDEQGHITGYERVLHSQPTTIYEAGNRSQCKLADPLPLDYAVFTAALSAAMNPAASVEAKLAPQKPTETAAATDKEPIAAKK